MASVPDQTDVRRRQYIAAAAQTNFTYPFKIFEEEDLDVFQQAVGGPIINLALNVDYTVTNVGSVGGGDVVLVVPAVINDIITINSDVAESQLVDFSTGGKFDPATVNFVHDKETILIQQVSNRIEQRMLTYAVTDTLSTTGGDTVLPQLPANTGVGIPVWTKNSAGNLVAGVCTEDPDCSTLRIELASETSIAPGSDNVGVFDNNDPGGPIGKTLTQLIGETNPVQDNRVVIANLADNTKQIKFDASAITTGNARTIIMPDQDVDLGSIVAPLNSGIIKGLTISNDASDLDKNIRFETGVGVSSDETTFMELTSPLIKFIDTPWVPGDSAGGLFSGVLTLDTTYHFFIIKDLIGNLVDCGASTSPIAADRPAAYTKFERVGSLFTDSSTNLIQFVQSLNFPDEFILKTPIVAFSTTSQTKDVPILHYMFVPTDLIFKSIATYAISADDTNSGIGRLSVNSPATDDYAVPNDFATLRISTPIDDVIFANNTTLRVQTNTSGEVKTRLENSTGGGTKTIRGLSLGWEDLRGKT